MGAISVKRLEWGNHTLGTRIFDLVLASDVIYFADSLQPLVDCIRQYMKVGTGRCLLVNDSQRYDVFADRFEVMLQAAGFKKILQTEESTVTIIVLCLE